MWRRLETAVVNHVQHAVAQVDPGFTFSTGRLFLPMKEGGLGLLSPTRCAPGAYKASRETSLAFAANCFSINLPGLQEEYQAYRNATISDPTSSYPTSDWFSDGAFADSRPQTLDFPLDLPLLDNDVAILQGTYPSQAILLQKDYTALQTNQLQELLSKEANHNPQDVSKLIQDPSTVSWLRKPLTITSPPITHLETCAALLIQLQGHNSTCRNCGLLNTTTDHLQRCAISKVTARDRHDTIASVLQRHLHTHGLHTQLEPTSQRPGSHLRADLTYWDGSHTPATIDFVITDKTSTNMNVTLDQVFELKRRKHSNETYEGHFSPFVIHSQGLLHPQTLSLIKSLPDHPQLLHEIQVSLAAWRGRLILRARTGV